MDGYDFYHEALKYADNISFACTNAYMNEIEQEGSIYGTHFEQLFAEPYRFYVNVLYNLGFMWMDIINYIFYNQNTVP